MCAFVTVSCQKYINNYQ